MFPSCKGEGTPPPPKEQVYIIFTAQKNIFPEGIILSYQWFCFIFIHPEKNFSKRYYSELCLWYFFFFFFFFLMLPRQLLKGPTNPNQIFTHDFLLE